MEPYHSSSGTYFVGRSATRRRCRRPTYDPKRQFCVRRYSKIFSDVKMVSGTMQDVVVVCRSAIHRRPMHHLQLQLFMLCYDHTFDKCSSRGRGVITLS